MKIIPSQSSPVRSTSTAQIMVLLSRLIGTPLVVGAAWLRAKMAVSSITVKTTTKPRSRVSCSSSSFDSSGLCGEAR